MSKAHEAYQEKSSSLPPAPPIYGNYAEPPFPPQAYDIPPVVTNEEARLQAFRNVIARHEISNFMALKLRKLEAYDIVIIADDSGSMQTRSTLGLSTNDPFAKTSTRWDELKSTVSIVTEIGAALDEDGVDIYFLNRPPVRNVTGPTAEMNSAFASPPMGYTPIARVLRQVLREKGLGQGENAKKLLILIATDGQPTTDQGQIDKQGLHHVLMYERGSNPSSGNVPIVFLACTDDENEIAYLNEWDKRVPCLDVVDDYYSERKEILAVQGNGFPFSRGDWVCKALLGAIDPEIDALDERRMFGTSNTLGVPAGAGVSRRLSTRSNTGKKECVTM
ncbi:UNVERIFIED_CONTAM: hypothetical protein HDU68_004463 [Siphonaria sp. JEL0065]|nr:hypothetical protein HDU68_004463 [Siphonaria sp. JEL0065]